jgi:hypothetical protein
VTEYIPLFEKSGLFIMQLDNLVNDQFTGIYSGESFKFLPLPVVDEITSYHVCHLLRLFTCSTSSPKG